MWLYQSEQVRQRAQQTLSAAPPPLQQAGQTAVATASASAQRVAEVIQTAPLPATVKDVAARVSGARGGQSATGQGGTTAPDDIGTPGVESAAGRDRTEPGGDLPADLAQP